MSRKLDDLNPTFRLLAEALLARLDEAGIPCMIIDTLRTAGEQAEKIKAGLSWTTHSKHEDGMAIDICPYEIYREHGESRLAWNADDPVWQRIGRIGEELGLVWGGRWKQRDMGHFEI